MKTLLTATPLAIAGVVSIQAADIAPVAAHWAKLGEHSSAFATAKTLWRVWTRPRKPSLECSTGAISAS
jgi:hypothetical protein